MSVSSTEAQISLTSHVRHRAVAEDGVIVNLESARVVIVNEIGLHIIEQLTSPKTRKALTESITSAFDVGVEQAATDLEMYIAELDKEQILEQQHVQD